MSGNITEQQNIWRSDPDGRASRDNSPWGRRIKKDQVIGRYWVEPRYSLKQFETDEGPLTIRDNPAGGLTYEWVKRSAISSAPPVPEWGDIKPGETLQFGLTTRSTLRTVGLFSRRIVTETYRRKLVVVGK